MDPEVLVRVATDDGFDSRIEFLRILKDVTRFVAGFFHRDLWQEFNFEPPGAGNARD